MQSSIFIDQESLQRKTTCTILYIQKANFFCKTFIYICKSQKLWKKQDNLRYIFYPFVGFWNVTYRFHLAFSTKITWGILIYIVMPLQVQNITYDNIYYILEFSQTPESKNWVNNRYLNTINCVAMAKMHIYRIYKKMYW